MPAMNEKLLKLLVGQEERYPHALEQQYPRVFNRILELWESPEIDQYFQTLLVDQRGNRKGFPGEVVSDIFFLSVAHPKLRNRPQVVATWSHVKAEKQIREIEQLGIPFSPKGFIHSAESGNRDAVALFLSSGINVDSRDERGWTPLMVAAFNGHEDVAILLIRSGADIHARDRGGYTPLHWAAFNGYAKVVELLLEKDADPNVRSNFGWTPLLQAATRGHAQISALLLTKNADPNAASNDGWTPLHKAAANGHTEVVKLLIARGANVNAVYSDGSTPLSLASKNHHSGIVALLAVHR
jgi:uncharacterized protein